MVVLARCRFEVNRLLVPGEMEEMAIEDMERLISKLELESDVEVNTKPPRYEAYVMEKDEDIVRFGELLHQSWQLKRSLSDKISTPYIDYLYDTARNAGAAGGKILGAGGGGFILFFVRPEIQPKFIESLPGLLHVPFRFENSGSQIIFYEPDAQYSSAKAEEVLWLK